jgi:hypothetical protein
MNTFSRTVIQAGQYKRYGDSVYVFEVTSTEDVDDAVVWEYCQTLQKAETRDDKQSHNGSCSFPYGLMSFGSLHKNGERLWKYSVTVPYCD